MGKLFHVYVKGRFGPESHIGFIIADNPDCLKLNTYKVFDIVKSTDIPANFWTNPLGFNNIGEYRRWQMIQKGTKSKRLWK
jgi:hypothetical protein